MNEVFNPKRFWAVVWILGLIVAIKLLWVVAEWIIPLPLHGVEYENSNIRHSLHYRYRLASDTQLKVPEKDNKAKPKPKPIATLSGYKLVGIYSQGSNAMATLMKGTKSYVLTSGENGGEVEGYHLRDVNISSATFVKKEKTEVLKLYEKGASKKAVGTVNKASETVEKEQVKPENKSGEKIIDNGDTKMIDRSLIQEYTQNPDKIWKNIGLYEVKHDGKLDGFKVRFVRKGSPFSKLGLQRGDVIKSINGEPIVDYATPMRMFRSADAIDDLSITIERNHEEQELKYEVK